MLNNLESTPQTTKPRPLSMALPRIYESTPVTPLAQRSLSSSASVGPPPGSAARKKVDGLAAVLETLKSKVTDTNHILARKEQQRKEEAKRYKQNLDALKRELEAAKAALVELQESPGQADAVTAAAEVVKLRTELAMTHNEVEVQRQLVIELNSNKAKQEDSSGSRLLRERIQALEQSNSEKQDVIDRLYAQIKADEEEERFEVADVDLMRSGVASSRTDDVERRAMLSRMGRIETTLRSHLLSESQLLDTDSAYMEQGVDSPHLVRSPSVWRKEAEAQGRSKAWLYLSIVVLIAAVVAGVLLYMDGTYDEGECVADVNPPLDSFSWFSGPVWQPPIKTNGPCISRPQ